MGGGGEAGGERLVASFLLPSTSKTKSKAGESHSPAAA
jgi:hypothetical protein